MNWDADVPRFCLLGDSGLVVSLSMRERAMASSLSAFQRAAKAKDRTFMIKSWDCKTSTPRFPFASVCYKQNLNNQIEIGGLISLLPISPAAHLETTRLYPSNHEIVAQGPLLLALSDCLPRCN